MNSLGFKGAMAMLRKPLFVLEHGHPAVKPEVSNPCTHGRLQRVTSSPLS
jgi:hypothetical protein